jgi:hypothetical protein
MEDGEVLIDDQYDNDGEIYSGEEEIVDDEMYDNYEEDEEEIVVEQHITLPQKLEELTSMFKPKAEVVRNDLPVIEAELPPTVTPVPAEIIAEHIKTPETKNIVKEEDQQADFDPEEEYEEDLEYIEDEEYLEEEEEMDDLENESGEEIGEDEIDDDVEYEEESDIDDSDLMKRLEQKYGRIEKEGTVIDKEVPSNSN